MGTKFTDTAVSTNLATDKIPTQTLAGVKGYSTPATLKTYADTGTTTNDSAAEGVIGQEIVSTVEVGSAVALTTATAKTVTSISLTAGDWDVSFDAMFTGNVATLVTYTAASLSASTDTMAQTPGVYAGHFVSSGSAIFNSGISHVTENLAPVRVSLASTTTYYLVAQAGFTTNTMSAYGQLRARRMR